MCMCIYICVHKFLLIDQLPLNEYSSVGTNLDSLQTEEQLIKVSEVLPERKI